MVLQCSGQTYVSSDVSQYTYMNPNMAETLKNVIPVNSGRSVHMNMKWVNNW